MPEPTEIDLSIVVPAYNEAASIDIFYDRVCTVIETLGMRAEFIFVNDGSTDDTLEKLLRHQRSDPRVVVIDLSRNYGKEIALTAGLDVTRGRAAIPIDADLQDPPELISDLVAAWQQGYRIVNARRINRQGETYIKKATASMFYWLIQRINREVRIPANVGDFRLIDRKALDAINSIREQHRFMKGIFSLVGFKQTFIDYERDPRFAGNTKFNYWKLWNLSLEGITSFTTLPLRLFVYLGFCVATMSFIYGLFILIKAVLVGDPVAGFPTLFVTITFLGGVQLMGLGVIGEYLGRVFNETKKRPLYFIDTIYQGEQSDTEITLPHHVEQRKAQL